MVKKPEKKIRKYGDSLEEGMQMHGYNNCIDDYEAYLPSEEEIRLIVLNYGVCPDSDRVSGKLAKAIAKRIGKG